MSILRKVSKGAKIRNRYNQVQGDCTHKEVQEVLFSMKKKRLGSCLQMPPVNIQIKVMLGKSHLRKPMVLHVVDWQSSKQ